MHFREGLEKIETFVAGVRTRFFRIGKGPPMLTLPGMLGGNALPAAEAASATHEVFAPDPPSFHDSEVPKEPLTMEFLGIWVGKFHIAEVGLRQVAALGFSAGATPTFYDKIVPDARAS